MLASIEYNTNAVSDEDAIDRRQGRRPMPDMEFRCQVAPDMQHSEFENKNRSWFHFRVRGAHGKCLRFNLMNLNRHQKMFNQGMAPVFVAHDPETPMPNILTQSERWQRVQSVFRYEIHQFAYLKICHLESFQFNLLTLLYLVLKKIININ